MVGPCRPGKSLCLGQQQRLPQPDLAFESRAAANAARLSPALQVPPRPTWRGCPGPESSSAAPWFYMFLGTWVRMSEGPRRRYGPDPRPESAFPEPSTQRGQLGRASSWNLLWAASLAEQDPEAMSSLDLVLRVLAGFLGGTVTVVPHTPGPAHKAGM